MAIKETNKADRVDDFITLATAVINNESAAVGTLIERLDSTFTKACECILACQGRTVVTGMGKSGHIASKLAATLASTGTPAFFLHPGEASHGDMGMITHKDVLIAISNSGETPEILTLLPLIKRQKIPLILITGNPQSTIADNANCTLDVSIEQEACPLGLAPTTSTTVSLVMGDALAIALLVKRGFTAEDFARVHPGGSLGKRLLLQVEDLYHRGDDIPKVSATSLVDEALIEMTKKRLGMTIITNEDNTLLGIYTDGDIRRTLDKNINVHTTCIADVMSTHCKTVTPDTLAAEALTIMSEFKITSLVVVDDNQCVLGILHMHDLLQAGVA